MPDAAESQTTVAEHRSIILKSISEFFGNAETEVLDTFTGDSGDRNVELFLGLPTDEFPFHTVFTIGLSHQPVYTPELDQKYSCVEFMIHLPFTWDLKDPFFQSPAHTWPIEWTKTLANSVLQGEFSFRGKQIIISNGEPPEPLGENTEQTCLLFVADFHEFSPIKLGNAKNVHFYSIVPLFTEERDFEQEHGILPFIEKLASVPGSWIVRPNRESFVSA